MEFLKKLRSPVALKSEPAQPQAQPEPETRKAPQEQKPPLEALSQPQPQAAPLVQPHPTRPPLHQSAQPQPQAPVWAQGVAPVPRQTSARQQASAQLLQMAPRVSPTRQTVQAAEPGPDTRTTARKAVVGEPLAAPQPQARSPKVQPADAAAALGVSGPTSYLSNVPGLWRTVWAMHPNKTKRRLRRLLLSWEKLGAYVSASGAGQELTPAAETAFLRAKIDIARSVGYLKLLEGTGGIAKEAGQKEAQFVELLERFPSLHSARSAGEAARRNLYYNWHLLYLFLHKMLGASPYEARDRAVGLGHRVETVITSGRTTSCGGKKAG